MSAVDRGGALTLDGDVPKAISPSITQTRVPTRFALGGRSKRLFDILVASVALIAFSPLLLLVAYAVKRTSSGPLLYGHTRIGLGGREFKCWKFRSMVVNGDAVLKRHFERNPDALKEWRSTQKLKVDPRVTRIGRVLRAYSVDELPQLLNVLSGDMSIVGPRPVVTDELAKYGKDAEYYYKARPGITGLWQVSGRSDTSYETRVALDAHYVQNWTTAMDVKIMVRTIPAVFGATGSY